MDFTSPLMVGKSKKTEKDGLPKGELGRIGLAIASNKTNIVYALIESKKMPCTNQRMVVLNGKKLTIKEILVIAHFITQIFT